MPLISTKVLTLTHRACINQFQYGEKWYVYQTAPYRLINSLHTRVKLHACRGQAFSVPLNAQCEISVFVSFN